MDIKQYLESKRLFVEQGLRDLMPGTEGPFAKHIEAMRYSLFAGGKRVRPILCLAAAEAVDRSAETARLMLPTACALECIHTYSLIHDDLPAMDDDALRRGKPTNHILFGDGQAVLAGDGLLTWAFELLADSSRGALGPEQRLQIIQVIARAAGPIGMVGGQSLDLLCENSTVEFSTLQTIHKHKTGALITAAVVSGALGAKADDRQIAALTDYGDQIGLAFQIVDDLLNVTSSAAELGKAVGSDAERGKATYPVFFGVEETRKKAQEAVTRAISCLQIFDDSAAPLRALAEYIFTRSN
ncbi:MAG: farnesyl-diphosphate synthase [Deltaproteobacteria bacterium]|nr:MAG: farnesyl-diphosphate synthase [Deltaproteobacteria bacterium]PIE73361.1 MAG: farnesyl-diphosphate synthase [Deltaproteobacteria bacterium]